MYKSMVNFRLILICVLVNSDISRADGIDLTQLFMHTSRSYSSNAVAGIILLSMVVNYILNLIVIGVPAHKFLNLTKKRAVIDTIWITIIGQATDRLGAILGLIISSLIAYAIGASSLDEWGRVAYITIPISTWIAISVSIWVFAKIVWKKKGFKVGLISLAAGFLTNPIWASLILGI